MIPPQDDRPVAPLLTARGIAKTYAVRKSSPVTVLRGIDVDVLPGEMVSIVGPSGSGKSTLLYCLAGLERADIGEIALGGTRIDSLSQSRLAKLRRDRLGFVFQRYNLIPSRPDLVFADEPTGALDTTTGAQILDLLRAHAADGRGVVVVTHDLDAAARADRTLVLRDGAVVTELVRPTAAGILDVLHATTSGAAA